jgi:hypothetical protein
MAKRFLSSIRLLNLSTDPNSASAGDMYYNSSSSAVKFYDGSSWKALAAGDLVVESGSSYPTTSLVNGKLFYNTSNQRTAIYFDSVWREFAYVTDLPVDGGSSFTTEFASSIDGGSSSTSVFDNVYDGGLS